MTSPLRAMVNSYLLVVIGGPTLDATEGGERMPSRRGGDPAFRPLKAFAFDPSRGRNLDNFVSFSVPYERLTPGPVGEYVAVIDFDASNGSYYEAADLDSPEVLIRGGLDPSESDPRFHSQMVYAVVSDTIRRFEFALGRKISWREASGREAGPFRNKLRVFPHAFQDANAFYDPDLRALLFGYFAAGPGDVGSNLPGQTVFTCLSHDIVVHETTHALIDGLRDQFTAPTHIDVPAFHEAFADIIALFQHFSFQEVLLDTIRRSGGAIHSGTLAPVARAGAAGASIRAEVAAPNPLVDLARQFGEATGKRAALRAALGKPADPALLDTIREPHERGSILVAAVFDAFFSVYQKRVQDLLRLSRPSGSTLESDLHPDVAQRLAQTAATLASHFVSICVRALDYCPPVDIRFGEFLRALVTADFDLLQSDGADYRTALIEAFRARGIVPQGVSSYSEDALLWNPPEDDDVPACRGLDFDFLGTHARTALRRNRGRLEEFAWRNAGALGLSRKHDIRAHSFRALHRVSPRGAFVFDHVVEFLQEMKAPLDPGNPNGPSFPFRGGTTVLLDQEGNVRYSIRKRIANKRRLVEERDFHRQASSMLPAAPFTGPGAPAGLRFAATHRGY